MLINKHNYAKHECFGSLAALLGIVSSFPQIYKTFKTRDARSFSLVALFIGFIRSILWILHGYYMNSFSGMASSGYGLFYGTFLLYAKLFFKSR
tara:strand:+ start:372 stop:653 length:282 start_codon:yes stop_codon:yes gene_type:complete